MNTREIEEVLAWLKSTDLVELSYRQGDKGFSLATSEPQAVMNYPAPSNRFAAVCSPAVGVFQWSKPGQPRQTEEGLQVSAGQQLGIVETGKGKFTPVCAAAQGRLARVIIEAGSTVDFGQPLFFIEATA